MRARGDQNPSQTLDESVAIAGALARLTHNVERFEPKISLGDKQWSIPLKVDRAWDILSVTHYQDTYYLHSRKLEPLSLNSETKEVSGATTDPKSLAYLELITDELARIHREVAEDFLDYHNKVSRTLSPHLRYGVIPRTVARELMPWHMRIDRELSPAEQRDAIDLLSRQEIRRIPSMTADLFFKYCRVAYLANPATFTSPYLGPFDTSLSGRELYERYADGRCGELLDIDPLSQEAFRAWYHGASRAGGHPWEIYRGGNSTHITLAVTLDKDTDPHSWRVTLDAFSSTRLVETVRIALALKKSGLPFEVAHHESLRSRLAGEDMIGIVPNGDDLRYGWHRFPRDFKVADCVYFDSLRPGERQPPVKPWAVVKGLVTWLPLEPLKAARLGS